MAYLEERGMVVDATTLPEDITPKNTVLFAAPGVAAPRSYVRSSDKMSDHHLRHLEHDDGVDEGADHLGVADVRELARVDVAQQGPPAGVLAVRPGRAAEVVVGPVARGGAGAVAERADVRAELRQRRDLEVDVDGLEHPARLALVAVRDLGEVDVERLRRVAADCEFYCRAQLFDDLLLLTANPGRVVYNGPMAKAIEHYKTAGFEVPPNTNCAHRARAQRHRQQHGQAVLLQAH